MVIKSYSRLFFSLAIVGACTHAYSQSTQYIYNLNHAKNFKGNSHGDYIITLASFKNKPNAERFYQSFRRQHPQADVHIIKHHHVYTVEIGPFHSDVAVRDMANQLSGNTNPMTVNHIPPAPITASISDSKMGPVLADPYARVFSLSVGPSWSNINRSQSFYLEPDVFKSYIARQHTSTFVTGEIFGGIQRVISPNLLGQIGAEIAATTPKHLSGDIWEDGDPDFDNYIYHYRIQHTRVALKGKLVSTAFPIVQPYIGASVGVGINNASEFNIEPKIIEEVPAPPFSSRTRASFAYTLNAGLQRAVDANWSTGVGYEFADWGRAGLGRAPGQTLNSGLSVSHIYVHSLMLSLIYTG